jgi:hypothetical protein
MAFNLYVLIFHYNRNLRQHRDVMAIIGLQRDSLLAWLCALRESVTLVFRAETLPQEYESKKYMLVNLWTLSATICNRN